MVGRSRCEALGFDRHWNCYWLLGAWEGNTGGAAHAFLLKLILKNSPVCSCDHSFNSTTTANLMLLCIFLFLACEADSSGASDQHHCHDRDCDVAHASD